MSEVLVHHVECGPVLLLNSTTPAPATVVASLPGPDGDVQLCIQLHTPVKHRLAATAQAADHPTGQFGQDTHGPFLWIYYVALHPRVPGTDLAKPATDLPVDVSYILDPTVGQADVLDPNKMLWVATAFLDHSPRHAATPLPSWPDLGDAGRDLTFAGVAGPEAELEASIDRALAQLSKVARIQMQSTLPRPRFQTLPAVNASGATYTLDDGLFRYQSIDVQTGLPGTRQAADADELLYWIVDDAARALAWSFAYRSPAAASGVSADSLKATVALPWWAAYVNALDPRWGSRTGATIEGLLLNSKPARRAT